MQQIAKLFLVVTSVIAVSRKISDDGLEMFPKFYRDMAKEKEDKTDLAIQYDGYPVEIHNVITRDGYILKCLRIPHGKKNLKASKEPVLIAHGFFNTAATFVVVSPERALPYLLADRGYDVWLPVFRGNPMSSGHVKYTQKDSDYWNFGSKSTPKHSQFHGFDTFTCVFPSLDEPGLYDMPAIIDMILNETGWKQLSIVCLSFGCRYTYITLTNVTGYNQKVHKVANMAPAVFVGATKAPAFVTQQKFLGLINAIIHLQPSLLNRKVPFIESSNLVNNRPCSSSRRGKMCQSWLLNDMGYLPSVSNHTTAFKISVLTKFKTSIKTLAQIAQLARSQKFIPFDYGRVKNQEVYGTKAPPEFDLTKVGVPSMVMFAYGDEAVPPEDIRKFYSPIPGNYRKQIIAVQNPKFTHSDFVFHDKVKELVYDFIIRFLEQNDNKEMKRRKDGSLKKTGGSLRRKST